MKIAVSEGGGSIWSKISRRRGHPPPTILRVVKLDGSAFHMVLENVAIANALQLLKAAGRRASHALLLRRPWQV